MFCRLWEDVVTVAAWSREQTLNSVLNSGKLQLRQWNWWDNCTGIIDYLMHRYSGGMHNSKVVWKRLKVKTGLGVHFLFITRDSLRKWENEYKNIVWLWEWWLMSLVLTGRWFVKSEWKTSARERSLPGLCRMHCLMIKDTSMFSTQKTSLKRLIEIKISWIRL